jgi:hypothetical protein
MKKLIYMAFATVILTAGCKSGNSDGISSDMVSNPATADGKVDKEHLPVMAFAKETHDFGTIKQGEVVTYNFKFTNTGKGPLLIANAYASCGCTVPKFSKEPVQPGGEGFLSVQFNSAGKGPGRVEKQITVEANTIPAANHLSITADIQPQ